MESMNPDHAQTFWSRVGARANVLLVVKFTELNLSSSDEELVTWAIDVVMTEFAHGARSGIRSVSEQRLVAAVNYLNDVLAEETQTIVIDDKLIEMITWLTVELINDALFSCTVNSELNGRHIDRRLAQNLLVQAGLT